MSDDNRLAPEVMIALNALENARAWDSRGVTSQDVAALAGMETGDLIDLTNEALEYCYKRGKEWAEALAERDGRFQEWIKSCPPPTNCAICEARKLALDRWQARMEADQERDRVSE